MLSHHSVIFAERSSSVVASPAGVRRSLHTLHAITQSAHSAHTITCCGVRLRRLIRGLRSLMLRTLACAALQLEKWGGLRLSRRNSPASVRGRIESTAWPRSSARCVPG